MVTNNYTFRHMVEEFLLYPGDSEGRLSDDHSWSKESIVNNFLGVRSALILQLKDEPGTLSDAMYQQIRCIEMSEVDIIECPCAPPSGCMWLKSKYSIPTPLITNYISDVKGNENFKKTTWQGVKEIKNRRIVSTRKRRHYLFREDGKGGVYLYVLNDMFSPQFTISGVFQNPLDVHVFPQCGEKDKSSICFPLDTYTYTDHHIMKKIIETMWSTLLQAKNITPTDNLNDDNNNRQERIKQV